MHFLAGLGKKLLVDMAKKKIADKVFLPGVQKDIKNKIYDASLFVMTSEYEGMPNALMEAMALGLPVISTNCPCGGPAFLIKNKINGLLINNNDVASLTKAIEKVLNDLEFSKSISIEASKISERLAPEKINKEWEEFIIKIKKSERS